MLQETPSMCCGDSTINIIDDCLKKVFHQEKGNKVSIETIKFRILNDYMQALGMSFEQISKLTRTHTALHPQWGQDIIQKISTNMDIKFFLNQDFISKHQMRKVVQLLKKNNYKNYTYAMLAVDGLGGDFKDEHKLEDGPTFNLYKYFGNLQWGVSSGMDYDRPSLEIKALQHHIGAVRRMYQVLDNNLSEAEKCNTNYAFVIYLAIIQILKNYKSIKIGTEFSASLRPKVLDECVKEYGEHMPFEQFEIWFKVYLEPQFRRMVKKGVRFDVYDIL